MLHIGSLTEWEREAVISYCLSVMTDDQRTALMRTLPETYNRLVGHSVMDVTQRRLDRMASNGANGTNGRLMRQPTTEDR